MSLRCLDDDMLVRVLGHLRLSRDLARFVCVSKACKAVGQRDACWAPHVDWLSNAPACPELQSFSSWRHTFEVVTYCELHTSPTTRSTRECETGQQLLRRCPSTCATRG